MNAAVCKRCTAEWRSHLGIAEPGSPYCYEHQPELSEPVILERAAEIIHSRSRRPKAIMTMALCKLLNDLAQTLRERAV